ncbi:sensor histidine kinase [Paenibacillus taiwanensis]|uniref:sensor histidine kinase n=1 Tax=Paenibacillus taiwanensis TaxID=401638 RepID=UPI00041747DB|nr:ATP-binding protein [Paenibacillus taiwanensis]
MSYDQSEQAVPSQGRQTLRARLVLKMNTLMFRFTFWYVLSLLTVILCIGLFIIGNVSHYFIADTKLELLAVEQKLKSTLQDEMHADWNLIINELLYPEHVNYDVKIADAAGNTIAQSRGWDDNIRNEEIEVDLKWTDTIWWSWKGGLFFQDEVKWNQPNGEKGTIYIHVHLNAIERLLKIIVKVLLFTAIISGTLGTFLIYHITRRNLSPLFSITNAVRKMRNLPNLNQRIPIPVTPIELTNLARTINQLLDEHEELLEREMHFITNASHELRTPLTAFRGHVNLIKRWGNQNPVVLNQSIQALDQESQRMQRLIIQLLAVARHGKVSIKQDKVNLNILLEEVLRQLWKQEYEIVFQLHDEQPTYVTGDREQLRQVAVILIENAIRYTNPHGRIDIRIMQSKQHVCFSVADTGIGIPQAEQSKIFDRFYRVDKARSRVTGGTGLGLAIARQLVNNHHGTITVKSELGQGSTFTVCFPSPV